MVFLSFSKDGEKDFLAKSSMSTKLKPIFFSHSKQCVNNSKVTFLEAHCLQKQQHYFEGLNLQCRAYRLTYLFDRWNKLA